MAAALRKCTTRLLPASPTYSVSRRSLKIPNGVEREPGVANRFIELQLGELCVVLCRPTTPEPYAPANGRNNNEGNTNIRLLPLSETYTFPTLSMLTSAGAFNPVAPPPAANDPN